MPLKKIIALPYFLFITFLTFAQNKDNLPKIYIEAIGSVEFESGRWHDLNTTEGIYGEFRIGYRFNKYFDANVFAGYERKYFGYYAQQNSNYYLLNMERHYVPLGINFRLYLSEFLYEKLKLWKKKGRWDIYNQVGLARLGGKDIRDDQEEFYRNQGAFVPYYLNPYVERYGHKYFIFLAGVRLNFSNHTGIFLEAGQGAFTDLQN